MIGFSFLKRLRNGLGPKNIFAKLTQPSKMTGSWRKWQKNEIRRHFEALPAILEGRVIYAKMFLGASLVGTDGLKSTIRPTV